MKSNQSKIATALVLACGLQNAVAAPQQSTLHLTENNNGVFSNTSFTVKTPEGDFYVEHRKSLNYLYFYNDNHEWVASAKKWIGSSQIVLMTPDKKRLATLVKVKDNSTNSHYFSYLDGDNNELARAGLAEEVGGHLVYRFKDVSANSKSDLALIEKSTVEHNSEGDNYTIVSAANSKLDNRVFVARAAFDTLRHYRVRNAKIGGGIVAGAAVAGVGYLAYKKFANRTPDLAAADSKLVEANKAVLANDTAIKDLTQSKAEKQLAFDAKKAELDKKNLELSDTTVTRSTDELVKIKNEQKALSKELSTAKSELSAEAKKLDRESKATAKLKEKATNAQTARDLAATAAAEKAKQDGVKNASVALKDGVKEQASQAVEKINQAEKAIIDASNKEIDVAKTKKAAVDAGAAVDTQASELQAGTEKVAAGETGATISNSQQASKVESAQENLLEKNAELALKQKDAADAQTKILDSIVNEIPNQVPAPAGTVINVVDETAPVGVLIAPAAFAPSESNEEGVTPKSAPTLVNIVPFVDTSLSSDTPAALTLGEEGAGIVAMEEQNEEKIAEDVTAEVPTVKMVDVDQLPNLTTTVFPDGTTVTEDETV